MSEYDGRHWEKRSKPSEREHECLTCGFMHLHADESALLRTARLLKGCIQADHDDAAKPTSSTAARIASRTRHVLAAPDVQALGPTEAPTRRGVCQTCGGDPSVHDNMACDGLPDHA